MSARADGETAVHWVGQPGEGPTSLHGNGAASFARTSGDEDEVTCSLCLTLLAARTPADDAGDISAVDEAEVDGRILRLANRYKAERAEARAEVDSLRAEVERLTKFRGELYDEVANTRNQRDSLRVTLAAVAAVVTEWTPPDSMIEQERIARTSARVRLWLAINDILAADPVSLADVREPCCSATTWEEHMENHHPTDSPEGL